jgi:citrate synthase
MRDRWNKSTFNRNDPVFNDRNMLMTDFLESAAALITNQDRIDAELYQKFSVKRGLRNADGSGVLVGLTTIGEVHGYVIDENEKKPVHGRLRYRGIEVEDITAGFQAGGRHGFHEVAFLLMFGALPSTGQLAQFNSFLDGKRELPEGFTENMILKAPSPDIMNKLARAVLASYSYDTNPDDTSVPNVIRQCLELLARFPTMVAYGFQAKRHYYDDDSLYLHRPQKGLSTAENLLYMVRPDNHFTPLEAEILDLALVLHAEHGGGNNSAFAVHVVSSSGTDTYSAIAAAVGSLKGPKHGGANVKVVQMMDDIKKHVADVTDEKEIEEYLQKLLRREAFDRSGLIYGMGHAVYTLSDPRATILKEKASDLAREKGCMDEFKFYGVVERVAQRVLQKKNKKPVPTNVDFYSGFVYKMLNIPCELYTPLFAVSRLAGWAAHRIEELTAGGRIMRPAYKSVSPIRKYMGMDNRAQ